MTKADYSGKTITIIGAAKSGIAAAEFLLNAGARVILSDSKERNALEETIATLLASIHNGHAGALTVESGAHREESFRNCDFVVVSPGVPLSLPIFNISRNAGIPVIGEIELAYRHLEGRIIGITGSNGKTTTTTLVAELLKGGGIKGCAAGNIGTPLISLVEQSTPEHVFSVELSSFQLESIQKFRPFVGSILNLTPDHMDRYPGFDDYIAAKERIFLNQTRNNFAVLNADDDRTAAMAARVASKPVLFSRTKEPANGAFVRSNAVMYRDENREKTLFPVSAISIKGSHNLENVLAACTMAILAGVSPETLEEGVHSFKGVEHRLEWVADVNGVHYYNDSKATNVDATIKALEAFPGNILLIAGGRDKAGDFTALRETVKERVKRLVVIGEAAAKISDALSDIVTTVEAQSMEEAIADCSRSALPGDIVLLAPACASFDWYKNYEHRGRVFKEAVRKLRENGI